MVCHSGILEIDLRHSVKWRGNKCLSSSSRPGLRPWKDCVHFCCRLRFIDLTRFLWTFGMQTVLRACCSCIKIKILGTELFHYYTIIKALIELSVKSNVWYKAMRKYGSFKFNTQCKHLALYAVSHPRPPKMIAVV